MKSTVLVLTAYGNRVGNLAYVSTRCSGLLQGKWKLVRGLFIFIAAHKSSLAAAGSRYLPPEVAVWLPVDRPSLRFIYIYIYIYIY